MLARLAMYSCKLPSFELGMYYKHELQILQQPHIIMAYGPLSPWLASIPNCLEFTAELHNGYGNPLQMIYQLCSAPVVLCPHMPALIWNWLYWRYSTLHSQAALVPALPASMTTPRCSSHSDDPVDIDLSLNSP